MNDITPFFTTDASLGRSIITSDDPEEVDKETGKKFYKQIGESAPSLWSIAHHHNLDNVYVVEDSMISFISCYKYAQKLNKQLIFGAKFRIVNDINDEFNTESNVIVFLKNSAGYKDLIKLYSAIHANKDRAIWHKYNMQWYQRGDWKLLQEYWTDNLLLVIPFYNSFLHKNLLNHGHHSVPEFGKIKPIFILEKHELPFDSLIDGSIIKYCKANDFEVINGHSIYYYKNEDGKAYQVFRAITSRKTYEMPEITYFSQSNFSFESWQERNK